MNEQKQSKPSNALTWRDYLLISLLVGAFYAIDTNPTDIINYPGYLAYCLWILVFAIVVSLRFRKFIKRYKAIEKPNERSAYGLINFIVAILISVVLGSLLMAPFNYFNKQSAAKALSVKVTCAIDSVIIGHRNPDDNSPNIIYYSFQNRANVVLTNDFGPQLANMQALNAYEKYQLTLIVHQALLGSYWLEEWKIEPKEQPKTIPVK